MTNDRDPVLESLFDEASQELADDAFSNRVMSRIDSMRRRAVVGWIGVGVVAAACVWLLSGPLLHAVNLATAILPESLVDLEDRTMSQLLAPVNSVAGAVGLGFLGLRMFYKKVFSRR